MAIFTPVDSPAVRGPSAPVRARVQTRALTGMLLATAMATLLLVADHVINTWTDGHLLAVWVALWTVVFVALAFVALPLRRAAAYVALALARADTQG